VFVRGKKTFGGIMATKAKLSKEAAQKADEIIAYHGYSSLDEMVENLISNEYEKIKSGDGDNKEEMAEKLSGLGYIS
jgi:hypothetical protein